MAYAENGNLDTAITSGAHSTADAGASLTTAGNGDLAAVFGNMLSADATGGNVLIDIVMVFSAPR